MGTTCPLCVQAWALRCSSCFFARADASSGIPAAAAGRRLRGALCYSEKSGGNCHRIGPSFSFSRSNPDAKKFASGVLDIHQTFQVRDEPARLQRENKTLRRRLVPRVKTIGALQRIESAVDLDGVHLPRGVFQFAVAAATLWDRTRRPSTVDKSIPKCQFGSRNSYSRRT